MTILNGSANIEIRTELGALFREKIEWEISRLSSDKEFLIIFPDEDKRHQLARIKNFEFETADVKAQVRSTDLNPGADGCLEVVWVRAYNFPDYALTPEAVMEVSHLVGDPEEVDLAALKWGSAAQQKGNATQHVQNTAHKYTPIQNKEVESFVERVAEESLTQNEDDNNTIGGGDQILTQQSVTDNLNVQNTIDDTVLPQESDDVETTLLNSTTEPKEIQQNNGGLGEKMLDSDGKSEEELVDYDYDYEPTEREKAEMEILEKEMEGKIRALEPHMNFTDGTTTNMTTDDNSGEDFEATIAKLFEGKALATEETDEVIQEDMNARRVKKQPAEAQRKSLRISNVNIQEQASKLKAKRNEITEMEYSAEGGGKEMGFEDGGKTIKTFGAKRPRLMSLALCVAFFWDVIFVVLCHHVC
ncbi:unnamed protein product [Miscanthus lutarioriparius]|uniref:Uncharacterized protein n=1 Tax=Miscanthus lutarioriparius TaxID=422564 RepID=A0A811RP37_9POAL|nr:unnamed protein product [Miscanthus lutarioriparius]